VQYSRTNLPPAECFVQWVSGTGEGNCVEIAHLYDGEERWTAVRDSKNRSAIQVYDRAEWEAFRAAFVAGRLDY
jgi:uncharacterized protein DUF397